MTIVVGMVGETMAEVVVMKAGVNAVTSGWTKFRKIVYL